jgi:hypothetical protein
LTVSERGPARAALLVAGAAALVLVVLLVVDGTRWVEIRITDSLLLVRGSHRIVHCLEHGVTTRCGLVGPRDTEVGAWPLAQYLLAVPLVAAGVRNFTVLQALAAVSSLAVGGMLLLVALPIRRLLGTTWAVVLGVALLTGPFVLYGLLPFGEALAAFLALAFVVAACARRPSWLLVTGLFAGITKETLAPFLLVLGVVCARDARDRWLPEHRLVLPMVSGLIGAVVLSSAFNVFRFGAVRNLVYTAPRTRVPGVTTPARLGVADWFAPNVGVVWFWSVAGLLCAGLVVSTVALFVRHRREPRVWLPPLSVVGVLAAYTAGLASWYSTFGWVAWGPRLTLPILPAVLVAGIWTARAPMAAGLTWLTATRPRAAIVGTAVALLGMAQVGVVWHRAAIELPLVTDAACPRIVPIEQASDDYFYGCGLHQAWRLDPLSLWEASRHGPSTQTVAQVLEVVAVAGATTWLYRRNRHPRRGASRASTRALQAAPAGAGPNLRARPTQG